MADDDREIELGAGDMVFVPGSGYDDSGEGVLHRSPVVHETRMRILLQTDCVKRR